MREVKRRGVRPAAPQEPPRVVAAGEQNLHALPRHLRPRWAFADVDGGRLWGTSAGVRRGKECVGPVWAARFLEEDRHFGALKRRGHLGAYPSEVLLKSFAGERL